MNVVAFVLVGMILGVATTSQWKMVEGRWKRGWLVAIFVGAGLSMSIEALQYFLLWYDGI